MPDLTADLLPQLYQQRLLGLELGRDFVHPAYQGYSILNIPASICGWLGASAIANLPLATELLGPLAEQEFQRVILVVVDALALERLQRWMSDGTAPVWQALVADGRLVPLTSIVPSTTSAAITTFWTGRSPTEHGLTGYEMWFKDLGATRNTITYAVASFSNDPGGLERGGLIPEKYLPFPHMGKHLAEHSVQTYLLQHASILNSGLSRTFQNHIKPRRYFTAADLWINLRQLVEANLKPRMYVYAYWGEIDTLTHAYGPDDERTAAAFGQFSQAFERLFWQRLSPATRQGTLLLLTADHGAVATQPDPYYDLRSHPNLIRRLHLQPTGENRLAYLYIRPGQTEAVHEYIQRTFPNQFVLVDSAYAVDAGLFGPGSPHPDLSNRAGDVIVAARSNAYLWWANKENQIYGRHGGLGAQEMLVPLLAVAL